MNDEKNSLANTCTVHTRIKQLIISVTHLKLALFCRHENVSFFPDPSQNFYPQFVFLNFRTSHLAILYMQFDEFLFSQFACLFVPDGNGCCCCCCYCYQSRALFASITIYNSGDNVVFASYLLQNVIDLYSHSIYEYFHQHLVSHSLRGLGKSSFH